MRHRRALRDSCLQSAAPERTAGRAGAVVALVDVGRMDRQKITQGGSRTGLPPRRTVAQLPQNHPHHRFTYPPSRRMTMFVSLMTRGGIIAAVGVCVVAVSSC